MPEAPASDLGPAGDAGGDVRPHARARPRLLSCSQGTSQQHKDSVHIHAVTGLRGDLADTALGATCQGGTTTWGRGCARPPAR